MTEAQHTPGPWRVDTSLGSLSYIRAATGQIIASAAWKHGQQDVPAIQNARLIATAPMLLTELEATNRLMNQVWALLSGPKATESAAEVKQQQDRNSLVIAQATGGTA